MLKESWNYSIDLGDGPINVGKLILFFTAFPLALTYSPNALTYAFILITSLIPFIHSHFQDGPQLDWTIENQIIDQQPQNLTPKN